MREVRLIWYFFHLDLESAKFPQSLGPLNGKQCLETMICALDVFTASGHTAWKSFKEPDSKRYLKGMCGIFQYLTA